jgi:hypothetical protein
MGSKKTRRVNFGSKETRLYVLGSASNTFVHIAVAGGERVIPTREEKLREEEDYMLRTIARRDMQRSYERAAKLMHAYEFVYKLIPVWVLVKRRDSAIQANDHVLADVIEVIIDKKRT